MIRSKTHTFTSYLLATWTPHLDLAIAIADSQYTALSNPTDARDIIITLHLEQVLCLTTARIPYVHCTRQSKGKLI